MDGMTKALVVVGVGAAGYFAYTAWKRQASVSASTSRYEEQQPPTAPTKDTWGKIQAGIDTGQKLGDAAKDLWKLINGG